MSPMMHVHQLLDIFSRPENYESLCFNLLYFKSTWPKVTIGENHPGVLLYITLIEITSITPLIFTVPAHKSYSFTHSLKNTC